MKKYLTTFASFIIMLCIGSVYAWSIIASELMKEHGFSAFQTQFIFGTVIAIIPTTMIFVGQLAQKWKHRYFGYLSGLLFFFGNLLASYSGGNFLLVLIGIGLLTGIATGFGYWVALTSPVQWFPRKKGLITGIAAAGFGLGAVFMSEISKILLSNGYPVLHLLKMIGIFYGLMIFVSSNFIYQVRNTGAQSERAIKVSRFIRTTIFRKLCLGYFLGTFAGLLIIGSLKIIGGQVDIANDTLVFGVALFAISNFLGRIIWGFFSDYLGAGFSVFLALLVQSLSIISLNILPLTDFSYLILSSLMGFGFGGNFVLFARETAQVFGVNNLGIIYPYVSLGYAAAGIAGPVSGGFLYDISGSFFYAIILASLLSLAGSLLFLKHFITAER
ncbi:MAG: MFS transporter [Candidatus Marinimicrobia bacterium]|nr:MFS transporter [Candidatus Neomarinimicrobiota bacterium]